MSNLERYFIRDVERLTGISAHSLRAWEKRYGVLKPHRTDTNIRFYDANQVRRLLNIAVLQSAGYRISNLMKLKDDEMATAILMQEQQMTGQNGQIDVPVNNLVASMLAFDERLFCSVLSSAIRRFGVYEAMLQIVYPFLRKTSLLWSIDNITPAQEHFASQVIRRKLHSEIDALPFGNNSSKSFLLFLPPGETHEIGLLFADYLIRRAGYKSVNLGPDLPYQSLHMAISAIKPTHLLTFFGGISDTQAHIEEVSSLIRAQKKMRALICTAKQLPVEPATDRIRVLDQPEHLFEFL
ncbi:MerR family transcriptional regulator [Nostoc ellipsosporum NOK]|nr:MerR family transcriptional regulator [Nostoc ellipsosporum NOK]